MDPKELGQIRLKQVGIMNGLVIAFVLILYVVTSLYPIKFSHFFLALGLLVLFQGIYGLIKGSSTKSIFPHVEKVAIYEKGKMGETWGKQRKVSHITSLILSILFFLQAFLNRDYSAGHLFQIDFVYMLIIVFFLLLFMNVGMIFHFRKVDHSTSERDWKGYTWKTTLLGVVLGIVFTILIIGFTVSYIISSI